MYDVKPAQFVISIDLEMSWGAVHHGAPHDDKPYRDERAVVEDVLAAMERYGISATWAIVGHLFLAECSRTGGRIHDKLVRPEYPWMAGDWYDLDPGASLAEEPTWYGPDLVAAVRSCPTHQEIGSHSFGHLIVGDPGCSAEAFRSDLEACHSVAALAGVDLRSFVFPRNSVGHLDVLAESGFSAFRTPAPERFAGMPPWRRRIAALVDQVRPLPSGAVLPRVHAGMVEVPQTYLFDPGSKTAERVGTKIWSLLVRRRLHHAVRTRSLFHLWFHTHNLAVDRDRSNRALDELFADARRLIDAGRLENVTMGQVAAHMGGAHETRS